MPPPFLFKPYAEGIPSLFSGFSFHQRERRREEEANAAAVVVPWPLAIDHLAAPPSWRRKERERARGKGKRGASPIASLHHRCRSQISSDLSLAGRREQVKAFSPLSIVVQWVLCDGKRGEGEIGRCSADLPIVDFLPSSKTKEEEGRALIGPPQQLHPLSLSKTERQRGV